MDHAKVWKGYSMYIVFGQYDGFHIELNKDEIVIFRLCLGRIAFCIMRVDLERMMGEILKTLDEFAVSARSMKERMNQEAVQ